MFDLCGAYPQHVMSDLKYDRFGHRFSVISMPRFGFYDDYGNIMTEEDHGRCWINQQLKERAADLTFIPKFKDEEYSSAERKLVNYEQDHRMFILREAYDSMIEYEDSSQRWYGREFDTWGSDEKHLESNSTTSQLAETKEVSNY